MYSNSVATAAAVSHLETGRILARIEEIATTLSRGEIIELLVVATEFADRVDTVNNFRSHNDRLTEREKEVLVLVAHGYSRRSIGNCLGISFNTAARHIANIYTKLGVSSVAEATQWAFVHQLISIGAPMVPTECSDAVQSRM